MQRRLSRDRRRLVRCALSQELILFHHGVPIAVRLHNLSEGGALLETSEHLNATAPLVLVLYLPDRTPLRLTARVRFCREGIGVGIEFIRLTPYQRRRIASFIKAFAPGKAQVE
jgi:hypothetical protein